MAGDRVGRQPSARPAHRLADDVVRHPEGEAGLAHQGIGQFGHRPEAHPRPMQHPPGVDLERGQVAGEELETGNASPSVQERLIAGVGRIVRVGEPGALDPSQHPGADADQTSRLALDELQHARVLLLWHDAADRTVLVAELDEPELGGTPDKEILGHARQMDASSASIAAASSASSREATASKAFSTSRPKPSRRIVAWRSIGKPVVVRAAAPSGLLLALM
jgi:hypothetical protein